MAWAWEAMWCAVAFGATWAFRLLVMRGYEQLSTVIDRLFPDTLPRTTAEWLDTLTAQHHLDAKTLMIPDAAALMLDPEHLAEHAQPGLIWAQQAENSYVRGEGLILLQREVFFGRDPGFWTVGAHELGHAWTAQRHPLWARAHALAAVSRPLATLVASGLIGVNALYGEALISTAAIITWAIVGALLLMELVEEALASRFAARAIEAAAELSPGMRRWCRFKLRGALMTYGAELVVVAVILALSPFWTHTIEAIPRPGLSGPWLGQSWPLWGLLVGALGAHALLVLATIARPHSALSRLRARLRPHRFVALWGLVYLCWGLRPDSPFRLAVALAIAPAIGLILEQLHRLVLRVFGPLIALPVVALSGLVDHSVLAHGRHANLDRPSLAPARVRAELDRFRQHVHAAMLDRIATAVHTPVTRATGAVELLALPLVVLMGGEVVRAAW